MKYYENMVNMGCFSRNDVCAMLGNEEAAHSLLYDYTQKGLIERIRRDLYVTISLETKQPIKNRYAIASNISKSSYISHHSAFEYYGCANQVYYEVYVSGNKYFSEFVYDGITFKHIYPHINIGVVTDENGIRTTDIERTILDSINDFEKIGGLEELLKCIEQVPSVKEDKLISYLSAYNSKGLYQKTGYILKHFRKMLNLSDNFFYVCLCNIPNSKRYLYKPELNNEFVFNKEWRLYVPKDLLFLISKGVNYNERI